jgi:tetratricopeptide (TPR) repeat protein
MPERGRFRSSTPIIKAQIKAQLHLGLVDDALETFRQNSDQWLEVEAFEEIVSYAIKNKSSEEADRIESEAAKLLPRPGWYVTIDGYARIYVFLMKQGKPEKAAPYLQTAIEWATAGDKRMDDQRNGPLKYALGNRGTHVNTDIDSSSFMEFVCRVLVAEGHIDKALEIVEQYKDGRLTETTYLQAAEKRFADGETEKAKAALRQAFKTSLQIEGMRYHFFEQHGRMASLAAALGEKELFYEIVKASCDVAPKVPHPWSGSVALSTFTRQLALYGNKDHPLHAVLEKLPNTPAEQYENRIKLTADLLIDCAVNRAILGDHVNARRLFKEAIEVRQQEVFRRSISHFSSAIIEARAYEKR